MTSELALLCCLLIACSCLSGARSRQHEGYFTIVAPGTIRSRSLYHISISLSDFHQSCWLNITIELGDRWPDKIVKTVEVEPGTTKLVQIQMPDLRYSQGALRVLGFRGIIYRRSSHLNIEELHFMVCLQTDKAKYKPGELVQYRVICIDRLTRPAKVFQTIVIQIYDGQGNLIKQLSDVKLVQGVFKGDLQISEYPVLGEWKIQVNYDGLTLQEKSFKVARYFLPRFAVNIITKKDVTIEDGKLQMIAKTSYTYGEPVRGNLTIIVRTIYAAYGEQRPVIVKEFQIDGETTISLDFKTDLNISRNSSEQHSIILYTFSIVALVQDAFTRQYSERKTEVSVHNNPFKIKVEVPKFFDRGTPVNVKVSVTDLEGNPIGDTKNPVKVIIESYRYFNRWRVGTPVQEVNTMYLEENGVGAVSLQLVNKQYAWYTIYAEYLGWISHPEDVEANAENVINLSILTERPEVGKELVVQLQSIDPIRHFIYDIISRGDIIQSERINVPANETTYLLRINATYSMVPKITLFVHRVENGIFDSSLKEAYVKRAFQNTIKIDTDKEVKPGTVVSVNVTTDEGSYVGLMGIDDRLLATVSNNNDLSEDHVFTQLRNYNSIYEYMTSALYPGKNAGLITFSNAYNRAGSQIGKEMLSFILGGEPIGYPLPETFDKPAVGLPFIRKIFSESWMFKDFERTPLEGLKLRETIPDKITSWSITGFSLNPNTGLSLTKNSTKLRVFQRFFVSFDLPSSVKEGEIIEIPVYIFNYMDKDLLADVTIDKQSEDLELLDNPGSRVNQSISKSIPAQVKVKLKFLIRAHKSGKYNITAKAVSSSVSDAVQRTLIVEPEGVQYSTSKTFLVNFIQDGQQKDEVALEVPENIVRGSESIQLSLVGDILGPLIKSLNNLVRVPYGNGGENINYLVSNLLVLKYLKTLNISNPSLENKAKLYVEVGYQTQLSFKHLDGSFSLFDRTSERTGDVGLTAFTIWGLQHAKGFIQVDPKVIGRGVDYIKSKQGEDGGFSSGRSVDENVALTALSLLALLADDANHRKHQGVFDKGWKYLNEHLDDLEQLTSAALSTYALVLGDHEKSGKLLTKLSSHASLTSNRVMWTKSDTFQSNLETTAGSFMSLLESNRAPVQTLLPIVKALVSTDQGENTAAHMIALEAMIRLSKDLDLSKKDLSVNFTDDQGASGNLHVDSDNAQILQTVQLPKASRKISLQSRGQGFAVVSVKYGYNLLVENQSSSNYKTNITVIESTDAFVTLKACVARESTVGRSIVTVMEINIPSGYTFDRKTFDEVQILNELIKSIQAYRSEGSVAIYLENISKSGTCLKLEALKIYNVFDAKPGSVVVYDFQEEDERSYGFFEIGGTKVKR